VIGFAVTLCILTVFEILCAILVVSIFFAFHTSQSMHRLIYSTNVSCSNPYYSHSKGTGV